MNKLNEKQILSDEELEQVTGGNGETNTETIEYGCHHCGHTWPENIGVKPSGCPNCKDGNSMYVVSADKTELI